MNLEEYREIFGFESPDEKYYSLKKVLGKRPLMNFLSGNYCSLKKYYNLEKKRLNFL
jgi:hypothetical protein